MNRATVMYKNQEIQQLKIHNKGQTISLFEADVPMIKTNRIGRIHVNNNSVVVGLESGIFLELSRNDFFDLFCMSKAFIDHQKHLTNFKVNVDDDRQLY